jgi:hypothetical protein
VPLQVSDGLLDRAGPEEAEVTVAPLHGDAGYVRPKRRAGAVDVQLRVAEPVRDVRQLAVGDDLGPDNIAVEPDSRSASQRRQ